MTQSLDRLFCLSLKLSRLKWNSSTKCLSLVYQEDFKPTLIKVLSRDDDCLKTYLNKFACSRMRNKFQCKSSNSIQK